MWEHTDEVRFNRSEPIEYRKQFCFLQTSFVRKFRIKQMRHLRKAFHALRVQKTLVIVLASEIILKGDGLQIGIYCRYTANDSNAHRLGSEALQERELSRSKGDLPIGKHHLAFAFLVLDQTGVFVCMTKHNKFSPFANARANTPRSSANRVRLARRKTTFVGRTVPTMTWAGIKKMLPYRESMEALNGEKRQSLFSGCHSYCI